MYLQFHEYSDPCIVSLVAAKNMYDQPIGAPLPNWFPPPYPAAEPIDGRTVRLEPLDPSVHGPELFAAFAGASDSLWTYMNVGPFSGYPDFRSTLDAIMSYPQWVCFAFVVGGNSLGFASYLRIAPAQGAIEIGSIALAPALQRTTPATEGLFLMIRHCFELGYRRCEWKCDDLNEPSRRAATRLGFTYEGTFRQALVYKQRNRDTAWYAILDTQWPALEASFLQWLAPENFNGDGKQRQSLQQFQARARRA